MKSLARPFVNFACLLSFFGMSACSTQTPLPAGPDPRRELAERLREKPVPAVLFVGNSYSFGVPKAFTQVAAENGRKVRVGHATYGGWSLRQHAANEATLRKIRDGRWDIVVIQEQSGIPALPPRQCAAAMFPPLRQLVVLVRQSEAVPLLYQTWGRRDGDAAVRHDDFNAMTVRLRAGYRAAAGTAGGLLVVPVGDAWQREVAAGRGGGLFLADGSHPTASGNRLTAETFYHSIFGGP
ncbi:hypothetical protein HQ447_20875 [bacterium]|nr:hypothetical protein [bacterium]